mmetsp:Transcript_7380/g.14678  ORF Transcript_7380/g.14678 Transcript_7380/m.14678 type:complete len:240 (-) Transcript_7380:294-1013(-)
MTDNFEKIAWKLDTNQTTSVYVPLHDMNRSIQKTYPPHVDTTVLAQAFVVKAINLSDLPTFVVATDERDPVRIADLEGQEEEEGLHGVVAPVDKVPKEEVVLVGTFAADLEQLDKIVELSVNVAAYRHGSIHPLNVALVNEDLPGAKTQGLHLTLPEIFASSQPFDLLIERGVAHCPPTCGGRRRGRLGGARRVHGRRGSPHRCWCRCGGGVHWGCYGCRRHLGGRLGLGEALRVIVRA